MQTATYKLVKTINGLTHYAQVTVTTHSFNSDASITIEGSAFFGNGRPFSPQPEDEFRSAVEAGIQHGLLALGEAGERLSVIVNRVEIQWVDSSPADVRHATCMAVWEAIGFKGGIPPELTAK